MPPAKLKQAKGFCSVKKQTCSYLFLLLLFLGVEASAEQRYEMRRTQVVPIQKAGTDRQYELYIKLPEDYAEDADKRYPVIYTTDAVWHIEMLSGATEYMMSDVILVGISWQTNMEHEWEYVSRFRDYSVVPSSNEKTQALYQMGNAQDHHAFIRDEVIGYVERNYRTDPEERAYFGYSLGSLLGAYTLLIEPGTFKHYLLGSPAIDPIEIEYYGELEATVPEGQEADVNVWVSIGELEADKMDITGDFVTLLEHREKPAFAVTGPVVIADSDHGTAFPWTVLEGVKWLSSMIDDQEALER